MNTPTHVVVNLLVVGRGTHRPYWKAILLGSLLPDLPMFIFYGVVRLGQGASESLIWSELYFDPGWQTFFDIFNSIPLALLGFAIARWRGAGATQAFFLSVLLHTVVDLGLHHEDAHRHFLPLAEWRFRSPVSYWDPRHHGLWLASLELLMFLGGSVFLSLRGDPPAVRQVARATLAVALAFALFAGILWREMGDSNRDDSGRGAGGAAAPLPAGAFASRPAGNANRSDSAP